MVYGIARQHDGVVEAASSPGQGATFRVFLPRCCEEEATGAAPAAPGLTAAGGKETILVVEDEPALLKLICRVLRRDGYDVLDARSPHEAEALVGSHDGPLHLLLTDMVMPGMSGRDLWRRVRGLRAGLRCVIMSGYSHEVIDDAGDRDVPMLKKPFSMAALVETVRSALDAGAGTGDPRGGAAGTTAVGRVWSNVRRDEPPLRPLSAVFLLLLAPPLVLGAAQGPPRDPKATRQADLVELITLDSSIKLDIRYAGTNNFLGKPVYPEARAFLQRPAAMALLAAHKALAPHGYGLLIHDGYRPWTITKLFWDMTAGTPMQEFVADPKSGSKHNRGCAVDLTIYDLATGQAVQMPGDYDEVSLRSYPDYQGGPPEARGQARPAARRDGAPGLHGRAERVVALQLQGLVRATRSSTSRSSRLRGSSGYSVFRNAMSAALSSADSIRPNGCPRTARVAVPAPLKPVGT